MPYAPSDLAATVTSGTDVVLTWTDNSSDETGFIVEKKTGAGSYSTLATKGVGVVTHTETGLGTGTFTYRVKATGSPDSGYSNELRVTIAAIPTDAYVRSGTSAATNFGTAAVVDVKLDSTGGGANTNREAYLRWDTTDILANVQVAYLRLYGNAATSAKSTGVYQVSDTTWVETTITWNTKPSMATEINAQTVGTVAAWNQWTVTSWVQTQITAAASLISFGVKSKVDSTEGQMTFHSREGANDPLLITVSTLGINEDLACSIRSRASDSGALSTGVVADLLASIRARARDSAGMVVVFAGGGSSTPEGQGAGGPALTVGFAGSPTARARDSGAATVDYVLGASARAQASDRAGLVVDYVLGAAARASAAASALLGRDLALAASERARAFLSGTFDVNSVPIAEMVATLASRTSVAATMAVDRALFSSVTARVRDSAAQTVDWTLAAVVDAKSRLSIALGGPADLAGGARAAARSAASLGVDLVLAARAQAVSRLSSLFESGRPLYGALTVRVSPSATSVLCASGQTTVGLSDCRTRVITSG